MRFWLALLILSCNIPSRDDVDEAVGGAVDSCRGIVLEAIPEIVGAATQAAAAACGSLKDRVGQAEGEVVRAVLEGIGCVPAGASWECSASLLYTP